MTKYLSGVNYPEELLTGRNSLESCLIGCIANDITLLGTCNLEVKDFIVSDAHYFFGIFSQMYRQKIHSVTENEVDHLVSSSESMRTAYEEHGGWRTIYMMASISSSDNFEAYLQQLCRDNCILKLYDGGFNLFKPVRSSGRDIIPFELFKKLYTADEIVEWYESQMSQFASGYDDKVLEEETIDFSEEYIERCAAGEETGVPFGIFDGTFYGAEINCLPYLSQQVNGFQEGTLNMLGGFSSTGKSSLWITIILGLISSGRKVLIISNEQKSRYFKNILIVWLAYNAFDYEGLTRQKMMNGNFNEKDKGIIRQIMDYWKEHYYGKLKFVGIPDADMGIVKKKVKENVLRYGFDTVLYDTFKMQLSDAKSDEKVYISLIRDSRTLDKLAKKYSIIMLASVQLAIANLGKLFLDSTCLSGAKGIKEICETLMLMRNVYPEELNEDDKKHYLSPFPFNQSKSPFRFDAESSYKVLFVDKNRNGLDCSSDGTAYLLKFKGQFCTFIEECRCKPKHGRIE